MHQKLSLPCLHSAGIAGTVVHTFPISAIPADYWLLEKQRPIDLGKILYAVEAIGEC